MAVTIPTSAAQAQIQTLSLLRADQKTTHAVFETTLQALRDANVLFREQIASLSAEIETLRGRIALLDRERSAEKAASDAEKTALEDRHSASEARNADLATRLAASDTIISLLRKELADLQATLQRGVGYRMTTLAMHDQWAASPTILKLLSGAL